MYGCASLLVLHFFIVAPLLSMWSKGGLFAVIVVVVLLVTPKVVFRASEAIFALRKKWREWSCGWQWWMDQWQWVAFSQPRKIGAERSAGRCRCSCECGILLKAAAWATTQLRSVIICCPRSWVRAERKSHDAPQFLQMFGYSHFLYFTSLLSADIQLFSASVDA